MHQPETLVSQTNSCLSHKGFDDLFVPAQRILTERLEMEAESRLHVRQHLFVAVTLPHDDSFKSQRIGHISVGMLFHDDLELAHHSASLCPPVSCGGPECVHGVRQPPPWRIVARMRLPE